MSNRIFTNGEEGKILTSVGNRIVKQPYEFGNAFQNRMGLGNYVQTPIVGINRLNSTIAMWSNDTVNDSISRLLGTKGGANNYNLFGSSGEFYYARRTTVNVEILTRISGHLNLGVNFSAASLGDTTGKLVANSNIVQNTIATGSIVDSTIDRCFIGGYSQTSTDVNTPQFTDTSDIKYNRLLIFSRELSIDELKYLYQNKQGNDPLSILSLELDYRLQQAEVINISGVDQPCVRDYSGNNRHGIIMNLPAGTAQQKVDYANANLFVPFLT